eukprot:TRINITY_DN631_c0_g1_i7.p1 TRINITY_DN631_c0_g1~~TRINITY_DN631_c0_g1_i7.p1  ORF type:complete len:593 (+),score=151.17 TRINITY_DN631_c0_g1_i7:95-1873(+)
MQAISQAIKSSDKDSFGTLLKKQIIGSCPELLEKLAQGGKCRSYLQHELALHHHLSRLTIRRKEDWVDVKCNADYITELSLHLDRDNIWKESHYDALLDCRHLRSVLLSISSSEAAQSASRLLKTLSYLPSLSHLNLTFGIADHSDFVNSSILAPFLSSSSSSSSASSSPNRFQHLESLKVILCGNSDAVVSFMRSACPHLSSLEVFASPSALLTSLALTDEQIGVIASLPLHHLSFFGCGLTAKHCDILSQNSSSSLSHLRYLRLWMNRTKGSGVSLASSFSSLQEANFMSVDFDAASAQSFLDHLPHLKSLNLTEQGELTNECVTTLSKIHSLMDLHIRCMDESSVSSSIAEPLANMPNLFTLALDGYKLFDSTGLTGLAKSTSLRTLDICGCDIHDDGLTALTQHNHSLTKLSISKTICHGITEKGLAALMSSSSHCHLSSISIELGRARNLDMIMNRNQHLTDVTIRFRSKSSYADLAALSSIPHLMRLDLKQDSFSRGDNVSVMLTAFAQHPHLEEIKLLAGSLEDRTALSLLLLRNMHRRRWWQRICCWIAFERANADSALRHSFIPFVEGRHWYHPNNTLSSFLS